MDEEVKQVVFKMGANKASGEDGLNAFFFQNNKEAFEKGSFLEQLKSALVVLIPKIDEPVDFNRVSVM